MTAVNRWPKTRAEKAALVQFMHAEPKLVPFALTACDWPASGELRERFRRVFLKTEMG